MSPPQKGLPLHVKESPGHCSLTLLNFLDSTYCYLELGSFACLLNVCLAFKTESFLQAGTLLSCSPQCPGHVAQGTWVFAEWTASLPVSSILSRSLSSQSSCLYLCLSPHSHFSDSVMHLISLCVCLSLSHTHVSPLPGSGTWTMGGSLGYTKRPKLSARLGTPAGLSYYPLPIPSSVLAQGSLNSQTITPRSLSDLSHTRGSKVRDVPALAVSLRPQTLTEGAPAHQASGFAGPAQGREGAVPNL